MNATDLRNMTTAQLKEELFSCLKEQFNLKMQQASGQLSKPHLMHNVRRAIARIKTILNEKQASNDE